MPFRFRFHALWSAVAFVLLYAAVPPAPSRAEDVISAIHIYPRNTVYTLSFLRFVEKVNAAGKSVVRIVVKGGPEAIAMIEQPRAVRNGVVEMGYLPGYLYGADVPEVDAMLGANLSVRETRANGGRDLLNEAHQKRFAVVYLAQMDAGIGYHIYMKDEPKYKNDFTLDMSGVKIRDNPLFSPFFRALGADVVALNAPDVMSAIEKGGAEAVGWTSIGALDSNWHRVLGYRIEPRFMNTDLGVIVNQEKWKKLTPQSRQILLKIAAEHEISSATEMAKLAQDERAELLKRGMKFMQLPEEAERAFKTQAATAVWDRMRERLKARNDEAAWSRVREKFYRE
ncbi:MAG: TRAP transporter substrate-binding protein DctP [Alphaproteobacteria bacterium]